MNLYIALLLKTKVTSCKWNCSKKKKKKKEEEEEKRKKNKIQSTKWRAEEDICSTVYFNTIEKSILISERHQENRHHH